MRKVLTNILLGGVACLMLGSMATLRAESADKHQVRKGDTLWDLSENYLHDPLLWPKIWKVNPDIADPHRIAPGQVVVIPRLGDRPAAGIPAEEVGAQLAKPAPPGPAVDLSRPPLALKVVEERQTKAEEAAPAGPVIDSRLFEQGIGIVTHDIPAAGEVLHTESGWSMSAAGGVVLVRAPGAKTGERYGVYRDMGKVKPSSGGWWQESPGHLVADIGIIEVVEAAGGRQRAVIRRSFAEVRQGDVLGPLPYVPDIRKISNGPAGIDGNVVAVHQQRLLAGPNDIVYIDRGSQQGLEPGQKLTVLGRQGAAERRTAGRIIVLRVTSTTAAALVTGESSHHIKPGDKVAAMEM